MHAFQISRPQSVADAKTAMESGGDGTLLAGGQTLIPSLKLRLAQPDTVVDLSGVKELKGISVTGDIVRIGAMTTHAQVASNAEVKAAIPALAHLAGLIGDPAVRHRGTIGGSIANSDPAADYPAAVLGLGATVHTNSRDIGADSFFTGLFETALAMGEIITAVSFPRPSKAAYAKFAQPASRFALVGVFVAQTSSGARVAVTGAGACAFRVKSMEDALNKNWSVSSVAGCTVPTEGLNSDLHASPAYRANLVTVMAERAVGQTV